MKNKKVIGYSLLIIIIILFFLFSPENKNQPQTSGSKPVTSSPVDNMHPPGSNSPDKSNVNSEILLKIEKLKTEVKNNPDDTLLLKEYADILYSSHKVKDAEKYYLKILEVDKTRIDILETLTNLYFISKNYKSADEYNKLIINIDNTNRTALYNAGAIAATTGRKGEARKYWQNLLWILAAPMKQI